MIIRSSFICLIFTCIGTSNAARAADAVDFAKQIKPILERSCLKCHGPKSAKGELRLHTNELLMKGGEGGPVIESKNAEDSTLFELITLPEDESSRMPKDGKPLSEAEIKLIRDWINQGATWPDELVLVLPGDTSESRAVSRPLTEAEQQLVAKIRELGGHVLELAQNDSRLEVAYHLTDGDVTDDHLIPLKGLELVTDLNLRGTKITDNGLSHIAGLKMLERLHLEKTQVTDKGMAQLKGLERLEYLNVYGTEVTDFGLALLVDLKNLKKLYVWQTQVTPDGYHRMAELRPDLQVNGVELPHVPAVAAKPPHAEQGSGEEDKSH